MIMNGRCIMILKEQRILNCYCTNINILNINVLDLLDNYFANTIDTYIAMICKCKMNLIIRLNINKLWGTIKKNLVESVVKLKYEMYSGLILKNGI